MTRLETQFEPDDDIIVVTARVAGPRGATVGRLVLDTGAVMTTLTPELAVSIGYSARDGIRRTRVHTAVSSEDGFQRSPRGRIEVAPRGGTRGGTTVVPLDELN